ncbi:DUF551 domain-containing protein [Enterobacter sp.]|uniref:DUF551 domain-containing protein n=1 Tax=Enterobacter sp. TaxID=42895 RepID=UPI00296F3E1D|nr:DUF551 domain-containing protein [Enterobacter sp.]
MTQLTNNKLTGERLEKILSETQAVINDCNARCVDGSVEVNARLFESMLLELQERRSADAQPVAVPDALALIEETWRLMGGKDPKTWEWHSAASRYLNACRAAMLQPSSGALQLPEAIADNRLNSGPDADDYYVGYQSGWNECLETIGVAPVNPELTTQWIPCSERLPDETGYYLVSYKSVIGLRHADVRHFLHTAYKTPYMMWNAEEKITHWMPLPAAPHEPTK